MFDLRRSPSSATSAALLLLVALAALSLSACRGGRPMGPSKPPTAIVSAESMTFWARAGGTPPPGATPGENACGATFTVRVMRVPQNHQALEGSKINQIDANANIQRSWLVPINLTPVAVDGDNVLLRGWDDSRAMLQIATDGLASVRAVPQLMRPEATACPPRPIDQYAADILCVATHDVTSGEKVLLEFEQPCE